MRKTYSRFRITPEGGLEVLDPGFADLPLLRDLDPGYRIHRAKLPGFTLPRFLKARATSCGLSHRGLGEEPDSVLWEAHATGTGKLKGVSSVRSIIRGEASLLELKIELARRMLQACALCGHACGVNRLAGELGKCSLGSEALVAEHFVHIAEEPPINPSLLISLAGCGLQCRFCQQSRLLSPAEVEGEPLSPDLWSRLDPRGARSLSFIGGNPDESLYAILKFLANSPMDWQLPVVWNSNGFGTRKMVQLLDGIVDVCIPDFKYYSASCSALLSSSANYSENAKVAIAEMLKQDSIVIVRILIMPLHSECCHVPTIRFLSYINSENLYVSIRNQYHPEWMLANVNGPMSHRPSSDEVMAIQSNAIELGLKLVE